MASAACPRNRSALLGIPGTLSLGELKASGTHFHPFIAPPRPQANHFVVASSEILIRTAKVLWRQLAARASENAGMVQIIV